MQRLILALSLCIASAVHAAEDPNDTYAHKLECPQNGAQYESSGTADAYNFVRCQCTSYVAHKLNQRWGNTNPKFTNQYYGFTRWSHAYLWFGRAQDAEIGITGARDNFVWDEPSYNAVFPGDVVLWEKKAGYPFGHVAYVEAAGADAYGKGVLWVTISEYNYVTPPGYEFSRRTLYKSDPKFPDYILHIDKDRIYCLANPTVGSCPSLVAGQQVANGPGSKVGGLGGGSDSFNLKVNNFWVLDAAGAQLTPDVSTVTPGQVLTVKVQVKALNGNTATHMHPGKNRIEIDIYARQDAGGWTFLKREYVQAVNLPSGATHTESITYTVPQGVSEVSFKAKIDAEDEAYEANEGDNWTGIQTFPIDFSWLVPIILQILEE